MPMNPGKLYINFGFWDALEGAETAGGNETAHINRELEKRCLKHGCKKTLYSSVYLDSEAFGREYNGGHYTVVSGRVFSHSVFSSRHWKCGPRSVPTVEGGLLAKLRSCISPCRSRTSTTRPAGSAGSTPGSRGRSASC